MLGVDCDDVMLLVASGDRTLTGVESARLGNHLAECPACSELADSLALPVIDPSVFELEGAIARATRGRSW